MVAAAGRIPVYAGAWHNLIMDDILHQLGELVLGSVPTMIFFMLLVFAYGVLVREPLEAVIEERRKRTTGAVEQARGAISAAEAETAVYEDKLSAAKAEIFAIRAGRLQQMTADRDAQLEQVRGTAQEKVRAAKNEMEQGVAVARQQIESASSELSMQVLRAILPAGTNLDLTGAQS
jgi:F-type H+-transporting ATPase subunit b